MIIFLIAILILTMFLAGSMLIINRKVVTNYRGGLMIIVSGVYFTLFFYIAYVLRENFK
jgi:hypothetical protein